MQQKQWEKIEEIFYAAVVLPRARRDKFVSLKCGHDREIFREVSLLLDEDDNAESAPILNEDLFHVGAQYILTGDELPTNLPFAGYKIEKVLGRGGMSTVYLAEDVRLKQPVALKVLAASLLDASDSVQRFHQEARAASNITHPNIAHIYEFGEFNGRHFLAMEYVKGKTLRKLIRDRLIDETQAVEYLLQIASALAVAHRHGIIHRDIKPENIIINEEGMSKIVDFGIAKYTDSYIAQNQVNSLETIPGILIGTTAYMSPEQIRGQMLDERTDIWSLGIVLYEMLSNTRPFKGDTLSDLLASILRDPIPPLSSSIRGVRSFNRILAGCLNKNRLRRYRNLSELSAELEILKTPQKKIFNSLFLSAPQPRFKIIFWGILMFCTAVLIFIFLFFL